MTYKDNKKSALYLSKEGYDLYAPYYDKKLDYLDEFEQEKVLKFLKGLKGRKILDVGCGTGRLIPHLLKSGGVVTGLDISEKMLEIAKKKFSAQNKVKFVTGDINNLPFKDKTFDVVVASFVIVHLKNLEKAFEEIYRVLKDGGVFVLTNINQKKAPKLRIDDREEIYIRSFYHLPKHVIKALNEALFNIEFEEFVYEGEIWINQVVKARK